MPATVSRPGATTAKPATWTSWILPIGLTLLGVLFVVVITLMFGRVSGEEFAPATFARRSFHYYELPIVGVQVWPLKRFDVTTELHDELTKKKLLTPPPTKDGEPRWDLVRGYRGDATVEKGDAAFLCDYLDLRNYQREHVWLDWTTAHPQLAKVFWPRIQQLALQELYIFMPDLFEFALKSPEKNAAEFERTLHAKLATKYYEFGLAQQKGERHALAVELLTEAVKLQPDNAAWKAALEASRQKLPKAEAEPPTEASAPSKAAAAP